MTITNDQELVSAVEQAMLGKTGVVGQISELAKPVRVGYDFSVLGGVEPIHVPNNFCGFEPNLQSMDADRLREFEESKAMFCDNVANEICHGIHTISKSLFGGKYKIEFSTAAGGSSSGEVAAQVFKKHFNELGLPAESAGRMVKVHGLAKEAAEKIDLLIGSIKDLGKQKEQILGQAR